MASNLPASLKPTKDVQMRHGTAKYDKAYMTETVTQSGARSATLEGVTLRAGKSDVAVILCGHPHLPHAFPLVDGKLVLNPGNVGLQAYDDKKPYPHKMESSSLHARYAIITKKKTDGIITFIRSPMTGKRLRKKHVKITEPTGFPLY